MEALSSTDIFLFEGFRLDRRGLFRRDEGATPLRSQSAHARSMCFAC